MAEIDQEVENLRKALYGHPDDYALASKWASALLNKLDCDEACALLWNDLVEGSERLNYDFFALLRDNFVAVANARSHFGDVGGTFRMASGVVRDVAGHISAAQEYVGDEPTVTYSNPNELASWPYDARLDLARRIWTTGTREADNVVWIGYRNTSLDVDEPLTVGQVTFYSVGSLREMLANARHPRMPEELLNDSINARRCIDDEVGDTSVFARVNVGRGPVGPAASIARTRVESLLDLLGRAGSRWQESGVTLKSIDGRMVGISLSNNDQDDRGQGGDRDTVATRINNLHGELAAINFDDSLIDCVHAMRVALDLKSRSDEQAVALIRGIEIIGRDTNNQASWGSFVGDLARDRWTVAMVLLELKDAIWMLAESLDWRRWIAESVDEVEAERLMQRVENGGYTYGEACSMLLGLCNLFDPKWLPARRLRRTLRFLSDDPRLARSAIRELGTRFNNSVGRLRRRRNHVTHGGVDQAATSRDTAEFARFVGELLLPAYTEAKARGNPALAELEAKRDHAASQVLNLSQGRLQEVATHWAGW